MDENSSPVDDRVNFVMRRVHDRLTRSTEKNSENDADDSFLSSMLKDPSFETEEPQKELHSLLQVVDRKQSSPLKCIENDDHHEKNRVSANKARFSALAMDLQEFETDEYESPCNKPKEAFMRGPPRRSLGECKMARTTPSNSQSRLPTAQSPEKKVDHVEERHIKFAQDVNVKYLPNESAMSTDFSTVLAGSNEYVNNSISTSSLTVSPNHSITVRNTLFNAQKPIAIADDSTVSVASTDEYGGHLFCQKKVQDKDRTPTKLDTSSSSLTEICSPKPFVAQKTAIKSYSPVTFTPKTTSSPKVNIEAARPAPTVTPSMVSAMTAKFDFNTATKTDEKKPQQDVLSPAKSAAIEGSKAKLMRQKLEEQMRSAGGREVAPLQPAPTPRLVKSEIKMNTPLSTTPLGHVTPHARELFSSANKINQNPTGGIQTQWRGQQGTPVVQGARAEEKTATNVKGPGHSQLKSLKSRWEFSSATGTPIHPDASEDTILAAAIRMKETALPPIKRPVQKLTNALPVVSQKQPEPREPSPIVTKSPMRVTEKRQDDGGFVTSPFSRPKVTEEAPEIVIEEQILMSESESEPDIGSDASRIIGQAFDFMDRASKAGTPSPYRQTPSPDDAPEPAPKKTVLLATPESIIEEETINEGDDVYEEEHTIHYRHSTANSSASDNTKNDSATASSNTSRMPYSVSFYRKMQKARANDVQIDLKIGTPATPAATSVNSASMRSTPLTPTSAHNEAKERLVTAIQVQDEHIKQSTRALALCHGTEEFRGSREEVEMHRALLIAREKKKALMEEMNRISINTNFFASNQTVGPIGDLTVYMLQCKMSRDVVSSASNGQRSSELYYFVVLIKSGEQVEASKITSSDEAIKQNGVIDVPVPLYLRGLKPDFKATVEIYSIRTRREQLTHEEKYKLKGATLKTKSKKNHGNISGSSGYQRKEEEFVLCGSFSFDINMPYKKAFHVQPVFPLEGTAVIKVKRCATEGITVTHRGFLSMYQRNREGQGLWNRYWCALENGEMKFWCLPEDESAERGWLVLLDLATCASPEGAIAVSDTSSTYLNSFFIDVWVPKENANTSNNATVTTHRQDIEKLRVMLAADTPDNLDVWLMAINESTRQLCTWRNTPV